MPLRHVSSSGVIELNSLRLKAQRLAAELCKSALTAFLLINKVFLYKV